MMSDKYAEWQAHLKNQNQKKVDRNRAVLQQAAMAVPPMEALTGDAHWDTFTKIIQAKIENLEAQLKPLRLALTDEPWCGPDVAIVQRITISRLVGQAEAFSEVLMIPKDLKNQGKEAANLLRKHGAEAQ